MDENKMQETIKETIVENASADGTKEEQTDENHPAETSVVNPATTVTAADLQELVALLKDIKESSEAEMRYSKKQSRWALISSVTALVMVGVLLIVGLLSAPKVIKMVNEVDSLLIQTDAIMKEADAIAQNVHVVMSDLEVVANNLAESDLSAMLDNVNSLVIDSQNSINEAMEKINSIDIVSLNQAIRDLGTIVEPLAKLFGGGRR